MEESEGIFEKARKYFIGFDSGLDNAFLFGDLLEKPENEKYFRENLNGKTIIDIGCGKKDIYSRIFRWLGVEKYIGVDPFLVPEDLNPVEGIEYKLGNPLVILSDLQKESVICTVFYVDERLIEYTVSELLERRIKGETSLPPEVIAYFNKLNQEIYRISLKGDLFICQNYLAEKTRDGIKGINEMGFTLERKIGEDSFFNSYNCWRKNV